MNTTPEYRITLISTDEPQVRLPDGTTKPAPVGRTAWPLFLAFALNPGRHIPFTELVNTAWADDAMALDGDVSHRVGTRGSELRKDYDLPITKRTHYRSHSLSLDRCDIDVLDLIDRVPHADTLEELDALLGMVRNPAGIALNPAIDALWTPKEELLWAPLHDALVDLRRRVDQLSATECDRLRNLDTFETATEQFLTGRAGPVDTEHELAALAAPTPLTQLHPAPEVQHALAALGATDLTGNNTLLIPGANNPDTLEHLSELLTRLATAKGAIVIIQN